MLNAYQALNRIRESKFKKVGEDVDYNVEVLNNIITVTFKGSNCAKDYWNDLLFWKNKYKDYRVHHGFLKLWKSAKDQVISDILSLENDNIIGMQIIGHSMGSALALLCYIELYSLPLGKYFQNCKLTLFACPRTFGFKNSRILRGIFGDKTLLLRNGSDLVTHVPPVIFGFRHVAKTYHIGGKDWFFGLFKVATQHDTPFYKKTLEQLN